MSHINPCRHRHVEAIRCTGCGLFLSSRDSWLSVGTSNDKGQLVEARYHRDCWRLRNPSSPPSIGVESSDQREVL